MSCWVLTLDPNPVSPTTDTVLGGSSSRSHISLYAYQRSPDSTGGLARHHRVCSLTVGEEKCSAVCCTWQVFDLGLCHCACLLNLVRRRGEEGEVFASRPGTEKVLKWPDCKSQNKTAFSFWRESSPRSFPFLAKTEFLPNSLTVTLQLKHSVTFRCSL